MGLLVNPPRMFWYLALLLLSPVCSLILRLVRDDRDHEILALRQQVLVLRRQLGKRPQLSHGDRLALVLTCMETTKQRIADALLILRPATLVGWHRAILRPRGGQL